jgi:hypothetical protein
LAAEQRHCHDNPIIVGNKATTEGKMNMQPNKQTQWANSLCGVAIALVVAALVGGWNEPVSVAQDHPTTLPGELPSSSVKPAVSLDAVAQAIQSYVLEELEKRGWTEQDLKKRRKTDALKVKMAARLRSETVMTLDWIARRLQMGCRHTVANCLKAYFYNSRD